MKKLGDTQTNPFKGTIDYINDTLDLNITIHYTDPQFADAANKGITEGENAASCLSLNLYKYPNKNYDTQDLSSYTINYINDNLSVRAYQFSIPSKDFVKELQLSEDGTSYFFNGYFSLNFNIESNLQRVIFFDFFVGIERTSTGKRDTTFGSLSSSQNLPCQSECTTSVTSSLQFCPDQMCESTIDKPDLYLNDQIWLKHTLTKQGTENYYLINPEIYFTGDKLFKKADIKEQVISQKGYAMYLINIEIAWTPITISAKAMVSSIAGSRILHEQSRLLELAQTSTIGITPEIGCVKDKETNECINCDQSQNVNNYDLPQLDGCPLNANILIVGTLILVCFFI
ncbi:unnamed protein product (macronuclear) [Paramecium tetraurelia]|uniref:Uncharacterized protein n=1 Tax=Paramecium tetraurelia TaxID=5888 RepID=A0DJX9_PARTE|nr:uncharacterized protein GSPATT00017690001 [Paramecium tetraurelia]CAK83346.1 unnamed protein product [Paramecium tetraurelia]|eukprot:XP_001450743.1 hypothetical protein (macronuclear) [Paramecium tetraurelia strain d4-2]